MPASVISSFAKKSGLSKRAVEKRWAQAKDIVKRGYDYDERDPRFWSLVNAIAQKIMVIQESKSHTRFKTFLEAAFNNGEIPSIVSHTLNDAVDIFLSKCSDAIWMIDAEPLWRGDRNIKLDDDDAGVVDTSATRRRSENTSNHYSEIFDNIPEYSDFPKRQRSFIASTSKNVAASFSGRVFCIIPFNGVKIGVCPGPDMWDTHINIPELTGSEDVSIYDINTFLQNLEVADTWEAIVELDRKLASEEDQYLMHLFYTPFKKFAPSPGAHRNFLKILRAGMAPQNTRMEVTTTKGLKQFSGKKQEVWVGGKCIILRDYDWDKFVHLVKERLQNHSSEN